MTMKTPKAPMSISTNSRLRRILVSFLALFILAGCGEATRTEASKTQVEAGEKPEWQGKLEATLAYDGPAIGRHNVLAELAREAADAGEGDVALKAIQSMDDSVVNSDGGTNVGNLCNYCSRTLAAQGKTAAVTQIAKMIKNDLQRNNTLAAIATGGS